MWKSRQNSLSLCVFCASSGHVSDNYIETAKGLGRAMAARGITLVYGGGNNGLMGILSSEVHTNGGRVIGIIPRLLKEMGFAYKDADEMIVTDDMRDRKTIMEKYADGFMGLAGGFGTLEEMLEILTLKQLEIHNKPIVFLNEGNFFSGLLNQFEKAYSDNFIPQKGRDLYFVATSVNEALEYVVEYS
jgi:uncharacterized protein (TIGR00730 family)